MRRMRILPLLTVLAAGLLSAGCGSDSDDNGAASTPPPPCNEDPWVCPAGQTCWVSDLDGVFACFDSDGTKGKGDPCVNIVGQPSCPDDMICLQLQGQSGGVCVLYCDPDDDTKGCDTGEPCITLVLGSSQTHACQPVVSPPDAGAEASLPDADASDSESEAAASDAAAE